MCSSARALPKAISIRVISLNNDNLMRIINYLFNLFSFGVHIL